MRKKRKVPRTVPPGDDVCPTPRPVDEEPPADRFCDLVLTGGVASGVVYPWAIVELARSYRFRNIGGTSVGAMAAALAAAAEYGRSRGHPTAFEPLRLTPASLGENLPDGRTRMLSLFQPNARGKRLIELWGRLFRGARDGERAGFGAYSRRQQPSWERDLPRVVAQVLRVYWLPCATGALAGLVIAALLASRYIGGPWPALAAAAVTLVLVHVGLGVLVGLGCALVSDLKHGVAANQLGLCKGGTLEPDGPEGERPGLSQWLHEGIQASAGLESTDAPLTFRDLWNAPAYPGAAPRPCGEGDPSSERAINLQVITSNVTHGRPYRLPLVDNTSRLFFRPEEWKDYFPQEVLDHLVKVSCAYAPTHKGDPEAGPGTEGLRELPGADLPLVVAARLSLSFPLLFSAVPLWAIDYEPPRGRRNIKRCQFTDGGVSSNFPIHLFDAALPRWPTFGLWLDRRGEYRPRQPVWLPRFHNQGWGDSWDRFDPKAESRPDRPASRKDPEARLGFLFGFFLAIATSATDWRDRTSFRLPHVRNRVARLLLFPDEGGLHIAMPRQQILRMAHTYGTKTGQLFVKRFADKNGEPSQAWSEQRWVRLQVLINGLCERLQGLATSVDWGTYTWPMARAIEEALREGPLQGRRIGRKLKVPQAESLRTILAELERLESVLGSAEPQPFKPVPEPELRLRPPL